MCGGLIFFFGRYYIRTETRSLTQKGDELFQLSSSERVLLIQPHYWFPSKNTPPKLTAPHLYPTYIHLFVMNCGKYKPDNYEVKSIGHQVCYW